MTKQVDKNRKSDRKTDPLRANPSPVGTQQNPVSDPDPEQAETNPVEEELRERERFLKEHGE